MLVSLDPEGMMSSSDPQPSDLRRVSHGEAVDDAVGYGVGIDWKRVIYREGDRVLRVDADHGADAPFLVVYTAGPWRWSVALARWRGWCLEAGPQALGPASHCRRPRLSRRVLRLRTADRALRPGQPTLAKATAVSLMRLENPHSLSYQAKMRTKSPSRTWVWVASKAELSGLWLKSAETRGTST